MQSKPGCSVLLALCRVCTCVASCASAPLCSEMNRGNVGEAVVRLPLPILPVHHRFACSWSSGSRMSEAAGSLAVMPALARFHAPVLQIVDTYCTRLMLLPPLLCEGHQSSYSHPLLTVRSYLLAYPQDTSAYYYH
jgi:hypothetical protein